MIKSSLASLVFVVGTLLFLFAGDSIESTGFTVEENKLNFAVHPQEWQRVQAEKALPRDAEHIVWVPTNKFQTSSLVRVPKFPRQFTDEELKSKPRFSALVINPIIQKDTLFATAVRNETLSGQLSIISRDQVRKLEVSVQELMGTDGARIDTDQISVRYVGYVPVLRAGSEFDWSAKYEDVVETGFAVSGNMNPDVIADPLLTLDHLDIPPYQNQPVWFTIKIPERTPPGHYYGNVLIKSEKINRILPLRITVLNKSIPDPKGYDFFTDFWFNPYAISRHYKMENWSEPHWVQVEKYLRLLAEIGSKSMTTIVVNEPWRVPWLQGELKPQTFTGYQSMIKWKKKKDGSWVFDYEVFDRYIKLGLSVGLTDRINVYSLTSFRSKERITYLDEDSNQTIEKYFDSPSDSSYKQLWKVFLSDFHMHLIELGVEDKTYLSFDERPPEIMTSITDFIKEEVPYFSDKISIAGHPESDTFATGLLSISYEYFPDQNLYKSETMDVINSRNEKNLLTTFYLCGQPAHPNSFTFSPAVESRIIPWAAIKYNTNGYLRWAFNNWTEQPFSNPVYNFIQGDEYIIYPGKEEPVSSIRWELLKDGIEDYELFMKYRSEMDSVLEAKIIEVAYRNWDGRLKRVGDFEIARQMIYDLSTDK